MEYTLVQGDAVESLTKLEDNSVALCLTSPPYDNMRSYQAGECFDYHAIGEQLDRVLVDGGAAVVLIQDTTSNARKTLTHHRMVLNWNDQHQLSLFETCLYTRHRSPGAHWNQRFREDHDYIHIFFKGSKPRVFSKEHMKVKAKHAGESSSATREHWSEGRSGLQSKPFIVAETVCPGTVQRYTDVNLTSRQGHPAVMSDRFAADYVRCFSLPDDLVVDPFTGSGTTAVAALTYGRRFFGSDLSQEYIDLAHKRIASEANQQKWF